MHGFSQGLTRNFFALPQTAEKNMGNFHEFRDCNTMRMVTVGRFFNSQVGDTMPRCDLQFQCLNTA